MRKQLIIALLFFQVLSLFSCSNGINKEIPSVANEKDIVLVNEDKSIIKVFQGKGDQSSDGDEAIFDLDYDQLDIDLLHDKGMFEPYSETWLLTVGYMKAIYEIVVDDEDILLEGMVLIINNDEERVYIIAKIIEDYDTNLVEYRKSLYQEIGKKFPIYFTETIFPYPKEMAFTVGNLTVEQLNYDDRMLTASVSEDIGFLYMYILMNLKLVDDTSIMNALDRSVEFTELEEGMTIQVANSTTEVDEATKAFYIDQIRVLKSE